MPSRKQPPGPAWQAILEDIRSQNRAIMEAVGVSRQVLEQRIDSLAEEMRSRFSQLEAALQRIGEDGRARDASLELAVRDLKVSVQQNSADIRDLAGKLETLRRLEERVAALERRAT